jgi:hypothetical protein
MIKQALEYLVSLRRPDIEKIPHCTERLFVTQTGKYLFSPEPTTIIVSTLEGVVKAASYFDALVPNHMFIVFNGVDEVLVKVNHDLYAKSYTMIHAVAKTTRFRFDQYMNVEDFIIASLAGFEPTEDLKKMLSYVGNMTDLAEQSYKEDGVSQAITIKRSVVKASNERIENPLLLAPYRTFPEIEQERSQFILRVKKDEKSGALMCALFNRDDSVWERNCLQRLKVWIKEHSFLPIFM